MPPLHEDEGRFNKWTFNGHKAYSSSLQQCATLRARKKRKHINKILTGLRWPGESQRESRRFARIDSQKNPYFHNGRPIRANRLKPATRNFEPPPPPKRDSRKRASNRNPETIRENQAIRANLRIDSRESGHLSHGIVPGLFLD